MLLPSPPPRRERVPQVLARSRAARLRSQAIRARSKALRIRSRVLRAELAAAWRDARDGAAPAAGIPAGDGHRDGTRPAAG